MSSNPKSKVLYRTATISPKMLLEAMNGTRILETAHMQTCTKIFPRETQPAPTVFCGFSSYCKTSTAFHHVQYLLSQGSRLLVRRRELSWELCWVTSEPPASEHKASVSGHAGTKNCSRMPWKALQTWAHRVGVEAAPASLSLAPFFCNILHVQWTC